MCYKPCEPGCDTNIPRLVPEHVIYHILHRQIINIKISTNLIFPGFLYYKNVICFERSDPCQRIIFSTNAALKWIWIWDSWPKHINQAVWYCQMSLWVVYCSSPRWLTAIVFKNKVFKKLNYFNIATFQPLSQNIPWK